MVTAHGVRSGIVSPHINSFMPQNYSRASYSSSCNSNSMHYSGTIYGSTCDLYMANCWSLTCRFISLCLWPSSSRWWKCWMRACVAARRCWSWESCCLAPSARFSLIESHRVLARCSFATCKRVTYIQCYAIEKHLRRYNPQKPELSRTSMKMLQR